jgi:HAE1 family hydrophobic/amphiphilic exporter-1
MGAFLSVDEIGEIGIQATRQGTIIPLKEIATVKDAWLEPEDYARLNLDDNVTVYVKKTSVARTINVARSLRQILADFNRQFTNDYKSVIVTDRAESIERSIGNVWSSLLEGVILTSLFVYGFFWNSYFALIVLACIPVSVIATFIFMNFFGYSINIMTMSGLALSIGILVDSSVTVLENTVRRRNDGAPPEKAAMVGGEEVWLPLVASQVTNIVVFLPLIFIDKNIQLTYQGFAFTVTFSLIASTFAAVMLVPVLLSQFFKMRPWYRPDDSEKVKKLNKILERLTKKYEEALLWTLKNKGAILIVTLILLGVSIMGLIKKDIDWPTTMEENEFVIVIFPLAG